MRRVPSYPSFAGKHLEDPFFTIEDDAAYAKRMGRWPEHVPEAVVIS